MHCAVVVLGLDGRTMLHSCYAKRWDGQRHPVSLSIAGEQVIELTVCLQLFKERSYELSCRTQTRERNDNGKGAL